MNTNPRKSYKYKPTAYLILSILWMLLIFSFSAQPATESTKTSLRVGMTVGSVLVPDFSSMSEIDRTKYAESIEFPVRKTADATEYAILGILLTATLSSFEKRHYGLWGWLLGTGYAATDEIHQLFVPGRAGRFPDVCIDTLGAVIWLLLFTALRKLWEKIAKRRGFQYNKNRKK